MSYESDLKEKEKLQRQQGQKANMFGKIKDMFSSKPESEFDSKAALDNAFKAGVDTDGMQEIQTVGDVKRMQNQVDSQPVTGSDMVADNSSKVKESNPMLDAAKKFSDEMSKTKIPEFKGNYGSINQAIGSPVDAMQERRAALMKLMGRE